MGESKVRILFVMHGSGKGGVEESIITLCKHLNRSLYEPIAVFAAEGYAKDAMDSIGMKTLIAPIESFIPPAYLSLKNMEEYYFGRFLFFLSERVRELVRIIKEHKVNVVHSSTITILDGAIASNVAGVPHICHVHGKYIANHHFLPVKAVYSLIEELSSEMVAVSDSVSEFIRGYLPSNRKIAVIYNGIESDKYVANKNSESALFREYVELKGKKIVALIGRVYDVKGIDVYVDAAINVALKWQDVALLVIGPIGDQVLYEESVRKIELMGLSSRIIFTGYRDNVPKLLADIDIVVCASISEGFPYVVLESMAASKPVISTRCGGPEEAVVDGETGLLVDVGCSAGLSKAIGILLDDEETMLKMGAKGKERAVNVFDADQYARAFEKVYTFAASSDDRGSLRSHSWELYLVSLSNLGVLGRRVSALEREVMELRKFEALIKDNILYKTAKKIRNLIK